MNTPTQLPQVADMLKRLDEHSKYIADLQTGFLAQKYAVNELGREVDDVVKHFRESGFIYIASPYSHADPEVRERRYQQVMYYTAALLGTRRWCYSPIVHCHELANTHNIPTDAQYWMNYNFAMLSSAKELHVYCLDGWQDSVGVAAETAFWRQHSERNVVFIDP